MREFIANVRAGLGAALLMVGTVAVALTALVVVVSLLPGAAFPVVVLLGTVLMVAYLEGDMKRSTAKHDARMAAIRKGAGL